MMICLRIHDNNEDIFHARKVLLLHHFLLLPVLLLLLLPLLLLLLLLPGPRLPSPAAQAAGLALHPPVRKYPLGPHRQALGREADGVGGGGEVIGGLLGRR